MFLGTYEAKLIGKNRLAMPSKIRDEIRGERIVLTIGLEECIFGFREKDWEEVVRPELTRPFFSDPESRNLRRKMSYNAQIIDLTTLGRFVMPETMAKYAGVNKEKVTIIGAADHFEIWDSQKWQEYAKNLK